MGDPIEIGAALEALNPGSHKSNQVSLLSSKATFGHSEPASGLTGLLIAMQQALHQVMQPISHLHTLNPYVAAAFDDEGRAIGVPRQCQPMIGQAESLVIGVSAFAFQGERLIVHRISSKMTIDLCLGQGPTPMRLSSATQNRLKNQMNWTGLGQDTGSTQQFPVSLMDAR